MNTNFDKMCRTCLMEKVNMRPIFDAFVADMLMACANVQIVEKDDLPQSICIQCLQQVNRSYSFKQLCEKSDSSLRQCLKDSQNNHQKKLVEEGDELENRQPVDYNEVTDNYKESIEYRIKTEQLKLEISEHLKLDTKQEDNDNTLSKIRGDENSSESCSSNIANEDCEDSFQCNECRKTFKGRIINDCVVV